jgi:large subunit ribosomal protein L29
MSDIAKVREMSDKELEDALREAKQDLWSARFALSTRQLNDTSSIPRTRRQIARILTVQRERAERGAAAATGAATARAATAVTAGKGKGA